MRVVMDTWLQPEESRSLKQIVAEALDQVSEGLAHHLTTASREAPSDTQWTTMRMVGREAPEPV